MSTASSSASSSFLSSKTSLGSRPVSAASTAGSSSVFASVSASVLIALPSSSSSKNSSVIFDTHSSLSVLCSPPFSASKSAASFRSVVRLGSSSQNRFSYIFRPGCSMHAPLFDKSLAIICFSLALRGMTVFCLFALLPTSSCSP
jgi:hypothetical protein